LLKKERKDFGKYHHQEGAPLLRKERCSFQRSNAPFDGAEL
jgi:hypothetical protein